MKECNKCNHELPTNHFYKNKNNKDGCFNICKICIKKYNKKNKLKKAEYDKKYHKLNTDKKLLTSKTYYEDNKDKMKEYYKEYNIVNKVEISIKRKLYDKNNLERKKQYFTHRRNHDPLFKLTCNIRSMVNNTLKTKGYVKKSKSVEILGCTFEELKEHIESQFEDWMSWDNKGNPKDGIYELNKSWDIDHIIPLSSANTEEDMIKLNHHTNLQPLCSYTNRFIKKDTHE